MSASPSAVHLAHDRAGTRTRRPPVVLLHGLTGSRETYRPVIDHLVNGDWWVVAADLRGHGDSPRADRYRAGDYATDVARLIEELGAGPALVVGHSLGGLTAHALAQRHPGRVAGLVLEDPPLFEGDAERRAASPAASHFGQVARYMTTIQAADTAEAEVAATLGLGPSPYGTTMAERFDPERMAIRARALLRADVAAVEAAISGETWVDYDPVGPVDTSLTVLRADPVFGAVFTPDDAATLTATRHRVDIVALNGIGHVIHGDEAGLDRYLVELDRAFAPFS